MTIINIATDVLKVHPRNTEFFDDISGEEYERFKDSIQRKGILSPLIVTTDMTVISGHQRLKASRELGLETVPVTIREDIKTEEEKLEVLLIANFGREKNDEAKKRKIAVTYVELKGIKNGQHKVVDNRLPLKDIAKQLGTSETTLKELLLIERKLTPELKEILDTGGINKTTASKILVKLSQEEQNALLDDLGKDRLKEMTQKQMQEYVNKMREKEELYQAKVQELNRLNVQLEAQQIKLDELQCKLQNRPVVEKTPDDYVNIKKHLNDYKIDYEKLRSEFESKSKEVNELKRQIQSIKDSDGQVNNDRRLKNGALLFAAGIDRFVQDNGGLYWVSDYINDLPDAERKLYVQSIERLEAWVIGIKNNLNDKLLNN